MRIKAITPIRVTDTELARRQVRYRKLSPAGIEVDLVNLPASDGVPHRLDTAAEIAASDRLVAAEIHRTDPDRYGAVLPDCVLDPGVASAAAGSAPVPVFGILQLSAGFLAALDGRFAAVTRNEPIAEEFRSCLQRYGLLHRFDEVAVLHLTFDDIEDEATWNAAIDGVRSRFAPRDVQAVLNGCSAVPVHPREGSVAVVDPTKLALRLLGVTAESGLIAARPVVPR